MMRDKLIILLLALIMIMNSIDVYTDLGLGASNWHIFEEFIVIIATAIGAISLIVKLRNQNKDLLATKEKLQEQSKKVIEMSEKMHTARHKYSSVIQDQFQQWQLSTSEQEIALLMLKGLNFKEIGHIRDTKEKTVRQQASNIYAKANVEGRHEFSAWFFEDFLG